MSAGSVTLTKQNASGAQVLPNNGGDDVAVRNIRMISPSHGTDWAVACA